MKSNYHASSAPRVSTRGNPDCFPGESTASAFGTFHQFRSLTAPSSGGDPANGLECALVMGTTWHSTESAPCRWSCALLLQDANSFGKCQSWCHCIVPGVFFARHEEVVVHHSLLHISTRCYRIGSFNSANRELWLCIMYWNLNDLWTRCSTCKHI